LRAVLATAPFGLEDDRMSCPRFFTSSFTCDKAVAFLTANK
jgi:hypothetical protein